MHPSLRMTLAVLAGLLVGNLVNGGLIALGPMIIPLPEEVDPQNMESLMANMHRFEAKHFIMPFLAHALGTLLGAFVAAKLVRRHRMRAAMIVGAFFFLAGIANVILLMAAPLWFKIADLLLAYFPFAYLGGKLAGKDPLSQHSSNV
ncbi:MAG: hypothetical protein AAF206_31920 [Bacteroidota bacterium]